MKKRLFAVAASFALFVVSMYLTSYLTHVGHWSAAPTTGITFMLACFFALSLVLLVSEGGGT